MSWWEGLTEAQLRLYGGYIDSRVRLLGDPYGTAVNRVRADDRIRDEVLAVTTDIQAEVRRVISDAYYDARNAGRTMEQAATAATSAVMRIWEAAR